MDCSRCGEDLEIGLDLSDFDQSAPGQTGPLNAEDCVVEWRLPTAGDVAAINSNVSATDQALMQRCVSVVTRAGDPVPVADWPPSLTDVLSDTVLAVDPLTDLSLALSCPCCNHAWDVGVDVGSFLWTEIDVLARRLVTEVHRLAAKYGWSEAEILAMSAARRAAYLRMCDA